MGLDVYLYRYENFERTQKLENEYEERRSRAWKNMANGREYKNIPEAEKDRHSQEMKELAISMGLTSDGSDPSCTCIEMASVKHPDHYFKIGYFRSSYNETGINRVLNDLVGQDLGDIFFNDDKVDEYCFRPNWEKSLEKCIEVLEKFNEKTARIEGHYVCQLRYKEFSGHPENWPVKSASDALKVFQKELEENKKNACSFPTYENRDGTFSFKEPMQVVAIIPGTTKRLLVDEIIPTFYLIMKSAEDDGYAFYREALEIVQETIEWVLKQDDPSKYYLHWSA